MHTRRLTILPILLSVLLITSPILAEEAPSPEQDDMQRCQQLKMMLNLIERLQKSGGDNDYLVRLKKQKTKHQLLYFEWKCERFWRGLKFD